MEMWVQLKVANVPPLITSFTSRRGEGGDDDEEEEGRRLSVRLTFLDPCVEDTHTVVIAWGDGATDTFPLPAGQISKRLSASHRYSGDSRRRQPVTATVRDKDGGVATRSLRGERERD